MKPASRCKAITVKQDTADIEMAPMQALLKFRTGKLMGWDHVLGSNDVFFGWNAFVQSTGQISIGDSVHTVGRTEKLNTFSSEE